MIKHVGFQKVLANAQARNESVMIVGPSSGEVDTSLKVEVSEHKCSNENCATTVVVNRLDSPVCPTCSDTLVASSGKVSLSYDEIKKDLVSLCSCDTCGQEVGSTPAIVKASIGKKLYCPVCASVVEVTAMDQEDEAEESEDDYTAEDDKS